jgi:hypothetical protein
VERDIFAIQTNQVEAQSEEYAMPASLLNEDELLQEQLKA